MDNIFSLEDFIPVYPKQDDLDVQYKFGVKKEFLDVSAQMFEPIPKPGELFKHQEAFKRYMLTNDRILNIQSVGTGKTCAMISVAEHYTNDPNYNNDVYILVRGPALVSEFKRQIACDCTNRTYLTPEVTDSNKDEASRLMSLTRSLKKRYQIMTYGQFTKEVFNNTRLDEENLINQYSGCIFLIDEAHYLIEKNESKQVKEETNEELEIDPASNDDKDKEQQYKVLWKLFHTVKRSKVILATATPMVNDVNEISKIMNLLLPEDKQMPLKWNYDKVSIEQLEPFFRGRVSYVKADDTGAVVEYEGVKMGRSYEMEFPEEEQNIPFKCMIRDKDGNIISEPEAPKVKTVRKVYESQSDIFPLVMSNFQKTGYEKAIQEDNTFRPKTKQASCFVFPDGSFGGEFTKANLKQGAGKYIKATGSETYELTESFKKEVKDNLAKYSCKYEFIINNELLASQRREKGEIVGTSFCYTDLKTGGGAIMLGKVMEEYGFEQFNESNSVFNISRGGNKDFCSKSASSMQDRVIRSSFPKKLRYAILGTNISEEKRKFIFELFNSPENANGDYIQMMIGTKASREGINVFSVLRGYLLTPEWHPSGMHQALARFIRVTSHVSILKLVKDKMASEGLDPALAKVVIRVYKLAALFSEKELDTNIVIKEGDNDLKNYTKSADLDIYTIVEKKDISIKRMMHILKRCALDCPIHHKRNTGGNLKDGSDKCDYDKCNYTCYPSRLTDNISESDRDYTTFDILYSQDKLVKECRDEIARILSKRNSISFNELFEHPSLKSVYKKKYIIMAIDKIIKDRYYIRNKFGFISFINTDGNTLFSQSEFPVYDNVYDSSGSATLNVYKNMLFGYTKQNFENIIAWYSKGDDKDIFERIESIADPMGNDYQMFSELFDKLSKSFQRDRLEKAINDYIDSKRIDVSDAIISKFQNYIYYTTEPYTDIANIQRYLETTEFRRGRNKKVTDCPKIDESLIGGFKGPEKNGTLVYLHRFEVSEADTTSFKANSQFYNTDKIRILKPEESMEWRDVLPYECQSYKNIIRMKIEEAFKPLVDNFDYFGTILSDKKFRIIKSENFSLDVNDKRSTSKGTECISFGHKYDLIEILLSGSYMPEDVDDQILPVKTKGELIDYLIKIYNVNKTKEELTKYSMKELEFIVKWFLSTYTKTDICEQVKTMFYEQGRVYVE